MDNIIINFMQDAAQGVYGDSNITYKDIHDFMERATPDDKRTVMNFYEQWSDLDNEEINTSDLSHFIKEKDISHN